VRAGTLPLPDVVATAPHPRAADGWQTVGMVADRLGVSTRTVLRWIGRGELEALRLPSGRLRISENAYNAWIASHTTGPE
jgi:excisionase family DNA binding protein